MKRRVRHNFSLVLSSIIAGYAQMNLEYHMIAILTFFIDIFPYFSCIYSDCHSTNEDQFFLHSRRGQGLRAGDMSRYFLIALIHDYA